jgi:hypothetical protein
MQATQEPAHPITITLAQRKTLCMALMIAEDYHRANARRYEGDPVHADYCAAETCTAQAYEDMSTYLYTAWHRAEQGLTLPTN